MAVRLVQQWAQEGYHVDLLLLQARGDLLELVPPQVRIIDLKAKRIRAALFPLIKYLRAERPSGLQVSMWPLTVLGIIASRVAGVDTNIVVSEHCPLSRQYDNLGVVKGSLFRKSIAWFYPQADVRIAVSKAIADDLAKISGIDRDTIDVVYSPAGIGDASDVAPFSDDVWGLSSGRILTVGRLTKEKNHALLIKAFAQVRRQRPCKLMIIGKGPLLSDLQALATEKGVIGDVLFPGFVLNPASAYLSADVFALSSEFEGFGLVLVEALSCGLPIVSTDSDFGPREILDNGRYGTLVPSHDSDLLAAALLDALSLEPIDGAVLRSRALELAGGDASARYIEALTGDSPKVLA